MDPATARRLVALVAGEGDSVLDPFCGAGTVLVEARALGARGLGTDVNPLAVAIARAKLWTAPRARRRRLLEAAREIAGETIARGKAARRAGFTAEPHRGPGGQVDRARDRAIGPWFAPHVRRELEMIAGAIDALRQTDDELGAVLKVALSAVLYKVSKRASDTDPRPTERHVARGNPARLFRDRVEALAAGLDELAAVRGPDAEVMEADARGLTSAGVSRGSIDAVVSSPPYAGTYDYVDQHQLRLDFFGLGGESFRASEIGTRRSFRSDPSAALRRWERDLQKVLSEITKVIVPGGRTALVIGDSLAGGHAVFADELLARAVGERMHVIAWASQTRPKLGGAEMRAFGDRDKREHIVILQR